MKKHSRAKHAAFGGWRQYFSQNDDIIRVIHLGLPDWGDYAFRMEGPANAAILIDDRWQENGQGGS
ncbi:hypothetical protein KAR10_04440 [bacterium]|nr:hypothetical protein [bacterium]